MFALDEHNATEYASYFADDAVLDVNGVIYKGRPAIYAFMNEIERKPREPFDKHIAHGVLSNPRIVVTGDTATVHALWMINIADRVQSIPRMEEQGHYDDQLIKRGGTWYFLRRDITSDGGLPDNYSKTYTAR